MVSRTYRLWDAPVYPSFIKTQRAKFLHYSLIASSLASFVIAIPNIYAGAWLVVGVLFVLTVFGVIGIRLNQTGRFDLAGWSLILLVLAAINVNLIDGAGLHDPAIAALPLLILLFAVLFDRNRIFLAAGLTVASVFNVYFLHFFGIMTFAYTPTLERVVTISILLLASSVLSRCNSSVNWAIQ